MMMWAGMLQMLVREWEKAAVREVDVVDDTKVKVVDVIEVEENGKVNVKNVAVLFNVEDVVNLVYVEVWDANVDVDAKN